MAMKSPFLGEININGLSEATEFGMSMSVPFQAVSWQGRPTKVHSDLSHTSWLLPFRCLLVCETHTSPLENTVDNTFDTNVDTNDFKSLQPNLSIFPWCKKTCARAAMFSPIEAVWNSAHLCSPFPPKSLVFSQMQGKCLGGGYTVGAYGRAMSNVTSRFSRR